MALLGRRQGITLDLTGMDVRRDPGRERYNALLVTRDSLLMEHP
jgi:hypothetical protein